MSTSLVRIPTRQQLSEIGEKLTPFLEFTSTASSRASFYDEKDAVVNAAINKHAEMFRLDRRLYALALCMGGNQDFAKQIGIEMLLKNANTGAHMLPPEVEARAIVHLIGSMPPQRMFKLFSSLKQNRVSNQRTKKLILRCVFSKLGEWWAVNYRKKLAECLTHAWGANATKFIKETLGNPNPDASAAKFLENKIDHFVHGSRRNDLEEIRACVAFVLRVNTLANVSGNGTSYYSKYPLLAAYYRARGNLVEGKKLPRRTLEGIRGQYHKNIDSGRVLELTVKTTSKSDKLMLQRTYKQKNVKNAEVSWRDYDPVRLYIYAFEMGMNPEIREVLEFKAQKVAASLGLLFNNIGVVVDTSTSMLGSDTQKMKPISTALAIRDVLERISKQTNTWYTSVPKDTVDNIIPKPLGATNLAEGLVQVLKTNPEAIFVISDGYENSPAGRFSEVVEVIRNMGINIPIYQISPVAQANSKDGVKKLCQIVPAVAITELKALPTSLNKVSLESDPTKMVKFLLEQTLPKIMSRTYLDSPTVQSLLEIVSEPRMEALVG